jgi:RNA polymerase sigma factor (sigma-70 family)
MTTAAVRSRRRGRREPRRFDRPATSAWGRETQRHALRAAHALALAGWCRRQGVEPPAWLTAAVRSREAAVLEAMRWAIHDEAGVLWAHRRSPRYDREDLEGVAALGVLRALRRYEPAQGNLFTTYVWYYMTGDMKRYADENGQVVRLPGDVARQARRCRQEDMVPDRLAVVQAARLMEPLDEPVEAVLGRLSDPRPEPEHDRDSAEQLARLPALLDHVLSLRERAILAARYGLDVPVATYREIARRMGLTATGVHYLERLALRKLRNAAPASLDPREAY